MTEQAICMSGLGLFQYSALDRMDVVFTTQEVRSPRAKADVQSIAVVETCGKVLGWTS